MTKQKPAFSLSRAGAAWQADEFVNTFLSVGTFTIENCNDTLSALRWLWGQFKNPTKYEIFLAF